MKLSLILTIYLSSRLNPNLLIVPMISSFHLFLSFHSQNLTCLSIINPMYLLVQTGEILYQESNYAMTFSFLEVDKKINEIQESRFLIALV